jgi:hypothetical protein
LFDADNDIQRKTSSCYGGLQMTNQQQKKNRQNMQYPPAGLE